MLNILYPTPLAYVKKIKIEMMHSFGLTFWAAKDFFFSPQATILIYAHTHYPLHTHK